MLWRGGGWSVWGFEALQAEASLTDFHVQQLNRES